MYNCPSSEEYSDSCNQPTKEEWTVADTKYFSSFSHSVKLQKQHTRGVTASFFVLDPVEDRISDGSTRAALQGTVTSCLPPAIETNAGEENSKQFECSQELEDHLNPPPSKILAFPLTDLPMHTRGRHPDHKYILTAMMHL